MRFLEAKTAWVEVHNLHSKYFKHFSANMLQKLYITVLSGYKYTQTEMPRGEAIERKKWGWIDHTLRQPPQVLCSSTRFAGRSSAIKKRWLRLERSLKTGLDGRRFLKRYALHKEIKDEKIGLSTVVTYFICVNINAIFWCNVPIKIVAECRQLRIEIIGSFCSRMSRGLRNKFWNETNHVFNRFSNFDKQ